MRYKLSAFESLLYMRKILQRSIFKFYRRAITHKSYHTHLHSFACASLACRGLQLCVVHRLDFSLKFLHHGSKGMWIHPILTQSYTDAQSSWVEIRVQQFRDLIQSLERFTSGVYLVIHRFRHAGSLPVLSKNNRDIAI